MQGRTSTAASPHRGSLRAAHMQHRQRRAEVAEIIASGLARAIVQRSEPPADCSPDSEDSAVDGLALSATSRLSVHTGGKPDRNESKVGEQA